MSQSKQAHGGRGRCDGIGCGCQRDGGPYRGKNDSYHPYRTYVKPPDEDSIVFDKYNN